MTYANLDDLTTDQREDLDFLLDLAFDMEDKRPAKLTRRSDPPITLADLYDYANSDDCPKASLIRRKINADPEMNRNWNDIIAASNALSYRPAIAAASETGVITLLNDEKDGRIELRPSSVEENLYTLVIDLRDLSGALPRRFSAWVDEMSIELVLPEFFERVCQIDLDSSSPEVELLKEGKVEVQVW